MRVGAVCTRAVVTVRGDEVVARAVERLRRFHVGDLVVIDPSEAKPKPIGVLTDRDIAVSVVATAPDHLASLRCDEVVRRPVVHVSEDDDLFEAIDAMIDGHLRRLPVVDEAGWLVGILTMDDVLGLLAHTLSRLTTLPSAQRAEEWDARP